MRTRATYLDDYYFVRGSYEVHLDPHQNLKGIVKFIEKAFNVSLGKFYGTYDWLCGRPCPTVYIDEMKEAFLLG